MTEPQTNPSIKGLVLIGGKSSRMGSDKSELDYHGISQKEYAKKLLEDQGLKTFFSVTGSKGSSDEIQDVVPNLGPFGGIYSAFQHDPNAAWFVLATDLPFVNQELIQRLLKKRNPEKMVTAIQGKDKEYPEPLITIYEPKIYPVLQEHLKKEQLSLVKILGNSDVEIIEVEDALIQNVNTVEEYNTIKKLLINGD